MIEMGNSASSAVRITDLDKFTLALVEICNVGLILGSSQFPILPQLPQKMTLASQVVKIDSKIFILLR